MSNYVCATCKKVKSKTPSTLWVNGDTFCSMSCRNKKKQEEAEEES